MKTMKNYRKSPVQPAWVFEYSQVPNAVLAHAKRMANDWKYQLSFLSMNVRFGHVISERGWMWVWNWWLHRPGRAFARNWIFKSYSKPSSNRMNLAYHHIEHHSLLCCAHHPKATFTKQQQIENKKKQNPNRKNQNPAIPNSGHRTRIPPPKALVSGSRPGIPPPNPQFLGPDPESHPQGPVSGSRPRIHPPRHVVSGSRPRICT